MNSEQTNELAAALAKAQGAMENAKLNKNNPYFKSKYADLASVIDAIKKPLADNGLGFTQITLCDSASLILRTTLMHSSGQWIRSEYPLPFVPDKPQVLGSAMTYARRYELAAICGIAAEEDDDANAAQAAAGAKKPSKPAPDVMTSPEPPRNAKTGKILPPDFVNVARAGNQDEPHDPKTGEIIASMPPDIADATTQIDPPPAGIDVQDMAREAAMRGKDVLNHFYKARNAEERAKIKEIMPELKELVDAADGQMTAEEGS